MWNSYPILRPTLATLAGMAVANLLLERVHFPVYILYSLLVIAVALTAWFFYHKSRRYASSQPFGVAALAAFFLFGATMAQWRILDVEAKTVDTRKCRYGVVDSKPVERTKWWVFKFREQQGGTYMAYLAKGDTANHQSPDLLKGDSIWLMTYFNIPTSPYLKTEWQRENDVYQFKKKLRKISKGVKKILKKTEKKIRKEKEKQETKNKEKPESKRYEKQVTKKKEGQKKKKRRHRRRHSKKQARQSSTADEQHGDSMTHNNTLAADTTTADTARNDNNGYSDFLFYQGIPSVIYCSDGAWDFCYQDSAAQAAFRMHLLTDKDLAQSMRDQYGQADFTAEALAIIDAMTTGDKTDISPQLRDQFSNAGISHVLALSGFHLTIIVSLIDILLLRGLFTRRWRQITALLVIPFIWLFAFVAGFPPSLVRATIMCSVFQIALVIGHGQQLKNAAAIAGFFMIVANPMLIMNLGFQLSFLSIIGIAVMGAPLCTWLGQKTGRWAIFLDIICISVTCTLFTFPVVAYHFGKVPLYSILSNLAVSVIATLFMWAAVLWWIFSWWTIVCGWLTTLINWLTKAMVLVADKVSGLPGAVVNYRPNIWEVVIIYVIISSLLFFVYNKKRKYLGISAALLLSLPFIHFIF